MPSRNDRRRGGHGDHEVRHEHAARHGASGSTTTARCVFTWDENRAGVTDKPTGTRNIAGGNLGGPIKKNKLFFFGNYEGTFERRQLGPRLRPDRRVPQRFSRRMLGDPS